MRVCTMEQLWVESKRLVSGQLHRRRHSGQHTLRQITEGFDRLHRASRQQRKLARPRAPGRPSGDAPGSSGDEIMRLRDSGPYVRMRHVVHRGVGQCVCQQGLYGRLQHNRLRLQAAYVLLHKPRMVDFHVPDGVRRRRARPIHVTVSQYEPRHRTTVPIQDVDPGGRACDAHQAPRPTSIRS